MEISKPKLLWVCPHLVLRYEEVPLLIDAGAEVIPSLGDPTYLPFDMDQYDNETNKMYPNWRKYCSLPTNITEKIRRINISSPSEEEITFMNKWLDIIFIASFPAVLEKVLKWFKGVVVFRTFGVPNVQNYTHLCGMLGVNLDTIGNAENYVWCPILKALNDQEDKRLIRNTFYLPAFVSKERLPMKWLASDSERRVTTLFSYIDLSDWVSNLFNAFSTAFNDIDFYVLGKNDKESPRCQHPSILGKLEDEEFYATLCKSRILCYGGAMSHQHLHFTPIEAMTMNVPILFLESCGLAREALEHGLARNELVELGMCTDYFEMASRVRGCIDDFNYLERLRQNQSQRLLPVFSREKALSKAKEFIGRIKDGIIIHKDEIPIENANRSVNQAPSKSIQYDLPTEIGQRVTFNPETIKSFTGRLIYDDKLHSLVRKAEVKIDAPGLLIGDYIRRIEAGKYLFLLEISSPFARHSKIGEFSVGAWNPNYFVLNSKPIRNLKAGNNLINLVVDISPEIASVVKEIRFLWNGSQTCSLSNVIVEKII